MDDQDTQEPSGPDMDDASANGDDTAAQLLQAFGTSQEHPLDINSDSQSNSQGEGGVMAMEEPENGTRAPSSGEDSLRSVLLHIELPSLSLEDKREYEPLPGSSIVHRVLRQVRDESGVRYNILFHDGHKETVCRLPPCAPPPAFLGFIHFASPFLNKVLSLPSNFISSRSRNRILSTSQTARTLCTLSNHLLPTTESLSVVSTTVVILPAW
jgi:hypothetical protein